MVPADAAQQGVDEDAHGLVASVDPGDDLGDHLEPGIDGDVAEALLQGTLHVRVAAMAEPERQEPEDVLQGQAVAAARTLPCGGLAQRDAPEEPLEFYQGRGDDAKA